MTYLSHGVGQLVHWAFYLIFHAAFGIQSHTHEYKVYLSIHYSIYSSWRLSIVDNPIIQWHLPTLPTLFAHFAQLVLLRVKKWTFLPVASPAMARGSPSHLIGTPVPAAWPKPACTIAFLRPSHPPNPINNRYFLSFVYICVHQGLS